MNQPSYVLDCFEGPLDLLLHLIKKNKISIYDIPISELSKQYIDYLQQMRDANLEVTSEFVVMASQLLYIKSKMLLPKAEIEEEQEDPRAELVERLLEYSKYKAASRYLDGRQDIGKYTFYKQEDYVGEVQIENVITDVTVFDLFEIMKELIIAREEEENTPVKRAFDGIVAREVVSVNSKIEQLKGILREKSKCRFTEVFEELKTRPHIVAMFLGVLELMKTGEVKISRRGREIYINLSEQEAV